MSEQQVPEQEGEYGSFLDLNLQDVPDLHAVPGNQEYRLKIVNAKIGVSKGDKTSGQSYALFTCSIPDEPDSKNVTEVIMLPSQEADEETNNGRKRQMKAFLQAVGFDISQGFNIEELVGEEFYAILSTEEDAQYGERNNIQRYTIPEENKQ